MIHRSHILSALICLALATAASAQTSAQNHRPDASGYPCSARDRLAVLPDDQGFSITAAPKPVEIKAAVPIGAGIALDRALFATAAARTKESPDAARR